jgi:hypothetical protein
MSGLEILGAVGTLVSAGGSILGGVQAAAGARAEAQAMNIRGKQERAAAEREAGRKRQEAQRVISRQMALASASGGDVADPTVLKLMSETAGEGELQASTLQYEGDSAATGYENQAAALRAQASQSMLSGFIGAGSSILGGFQDWSKYKSGMPSSSGGSYLSGA